MKHIQLWLIGCFLITLLTMSCEKENSYYDRMNKLAEEVKANPTDKTALHKLEKYTKSGSYWEKSYAYGFLEVLATQNVGGCQAELIPFINEALSDPDQGIRREAAQTVREIGSVAVDKVFPSLTNIVQKGKEDDVTWFSTQALGKLENLQKAQGILPLLLKAASTPPPAGTQDSAPQVRYYALDSIKELAMKNKLNVVAQLEELLTASKAPYKERVAKAILQLDSSNKTAQTVIGSSDGK